MPIVFDAPVSPEAQTAFLREMPVPRNLSLLNTFGITVRAEHEVSLAEVTRTNRVARYRSWDGRIHVTERDHLTGQKVRLAPFSDSSNIGEYERLQLEFARTRGTNFDLLAQALYDDTQMLMENMYNRMELALGDVLTDGVFSMMDSATTEFGGSLDFGVDALNKPVAAKSWLTDPTATPFADMKGWFDAFEDRPGGYRPERMIVGSRKVVSSFNTNKSIVDAIKGTAYGATMVTDAEWKALFASYDLPTQWDVVNEQFDVDGVATRVIPENLIAAVPNTPSDLMDFRMGLTVTAMELVQAAQTEFSFGDAAGIVGVVIKEGPPFRQFTFVDGAGLPILKDARRFFSALV